MLELVQKIVYDVTGKTGLTLDTDFVADLELNSFDIMNIICAFEDHFNTSISNKDVWNLHRVRDVIDFIYARGFYKP
jgi:acyl carrier protein